VTAFWTKSESHICKLLQSVQNLVACHGNHDLFYFIIEFLISPMFPSYRYSLTLGASASRVRRGWRHEIKGMADTCPYTGLIAMPGLLLTVTDNVRSATCCAILLRVERERERESDDVELIDVSLVAASQRHSRRSVVILCLWSTMFVVLIDLVMLSMYNYSVD